MQLWPQFRSPLVWDVFAVSTYSTVSLLFWYVGLIPDLATLRDRATGWVRAHRLRHSGDGLARLRHPLAPLRDRLSAAGRPGDAAGRFRPHGGELRLRRRHRARLALDHLPALLRGRGHLFRLRHGADIGHPDSLLLSAGRLHHASPPGEHGQDHAGDGASRRLRILHGGVRRLVQRQPLERAVMVNRIFGPLLLLVLGADPVQHPHPAGAVAEAGADQPGGAVRDRPGGQHRHVAGALRHRGHQPEPRLRAVVVGPVRRDRLGLGHLHRAPSACSWPCCFCSSASCRPSPSSRCGRCCPRPASTRAPPAPHAIPVPVGPDAKSIKEGTT